MNSDELLKRLFDKTESLDDKVEVILVTLERQHGILAEHMRRTLASENRLDASEKRLIVVEDVHKGAAFFLKVCAAVGAVSGALVAIVHVVKTLLF